MKKCGEVSESSSETLDDDTRKLEALQLLVRVDDRLVLTRSGRLMANEVSLR